MLFVEFHFSVVYSKELLDKFNHLWLLDCAATILVKIVEKLVESLLRELNLILHRTARLVFFEDVLDKPLGLLSV